MTEFEDGRGWRTLLAARLQPWLDHGRRLQTRFRARFRVKLRRPREDDFTSPTRGEPVAARIGVWLGVAFTICFVTGLLSHGIQHPPAWFSWPTRPVSLYRINQGLHVLSGVAAIPLLLAKLWSVYPRLFAWPAVRSVPHAIERLSVLVLIGAAFFELGTGLLNVWQTYPWRFFFLTAHYAVGWIAIGAIIVHLGVKLPLIRRGLGTSLDVEPAATSGRSALSRRGFVRTTTLATGTAVLATAGVTVPGLRQVSVLGWTAGDGPQGLPVNRTAADAGVLSTAADPGWRLEIRWPGGVRLLSPSELAALPQRTERLPIACVEGWSVTATWTGVSLPTLLAAVGAPTGRAVHVESLEQGGLYRASTLPPAHAADELTLLALRLGGQPLALDHGFPCRIIAASRPGVLQTKWVARLAVL